MNHDADDEEGAVLGAPSKKSRRSPFKGALLGCDWFAARSCNGCGTFGCNDCNDESGVDDGESDEYYDAELVEEEEYAAVESTVEPMPSSSSSSSSSSSGLGLGLGSASAPYTRRRQIADARLADLKCEGLEVETLRSAWGTIGGGEEDEASGRLPKCYDCGEDAAVR